MWQTDISGGICFVYNHQPSHCIFLFTKLTSYRLINSDLWQYKCFQLINPSDQFLCLQGINNTVALLTSIIIPGIEVFGLVSQNPNLKILHTYMAALKLSSIWDRYPKNFYRPLSNFCKVNRPYFRCYHSYILPIRLPTFNWRSFDYLKLFISRLRGLSDEWLSHMRVAQSISQHRWRSKLHVRTIVYIRHVLAHHEGHGYK